jgi:hypothetical protein
LNEREIIGAYNYIDIEKKQKIPKDYYLQELAKTL